MWDLCSSSNPEKKEGEAFPICYKKCEQDVRKKSTVPGGSTPAEDDAVVWDPRSWICCCLVTKFVSDSSVTPWAVAPQAPLWDSPGNSTGVCGHFLLQGIFLTQG